MKPGNLNIALIVLLLGLFLSGCGGGSTTTPGPTQVMVNFSNGTPIAVATQSGTSAFASMSPSSQIALSFPAGTTTYAIAYICPQLNLAATSVQEHVIEASTQDGTSLNLSCISFTAPSFGTATGSLSSTISGTAGFEIFGRLGFPAGVPPGPLPSGPFSVNLPVGTNDVAAVALDSSNNIVGIKILRGQTVPGALNGGSGIVVSDATVPQQVTVNNVPAGFDVPGVVVLYDTQNVELSLASSVISNPRVYAAIPAAETQSGDAYVYEATSANPANPANPQSVNAFQRTTNGGGPVTLTLPTPWAFSGPTPAKLPTFTFNYSGFAGQPFVIDFASITWSNGSGGSNGIDVTATANFLSGATNIGFPDLSMLPGFFGPSASGTTVRWAATIESSTTAPFTGTTASSTSLSVVANRGQFTQP
jgi:hypothetical protein